MRKKIFDILPPKKQAQLTPPDFKPGFSKKLILLLIILAGVGILIFLNLKSKLVLSLSPETERIEYSVSLEVNTSQKDIDFQEKIVPGELFSQENEKWQRFQSTGKDFEQAKARGMIRVYNATDPPTPITLRATTRFLSAQGGKIFRAPEKIYLPPPKKIGGKIVPSFRDVEVIAQEPGQDYNIGPSKFSVPGLAGTKFYYLIWAESEKKMEGGFKKEVKKVTEEDLEKAKESLYQVLFSLASNSLKNKIPKEFLLKEEGIIEKDFTISCFAEAGEKVENFSCQGKIIIEGIGFKISDLRDFAKHFLSRKIPSKKELFEQSLELEPSVKRAIIEDGEGKIVLELKIQGEIYQKISFQLILEKIKGKSKSQIEEIILRDYPQIKEIKFDFWPFWIKKAPKQTERINLKLTF